MREGRRLTGRAAIERIVLIAAATGTAAAKGDRYRAMDESSAGWIERRRSADGPRSKYRGRTVTTLRVLLPVATLALVAMLLAWPTFRVGEAGFMLSFSDLTGYDDTVRMVSPRYVGTDSRNQPFVITADAAIQTEADADEVTLEGLSADITLVDGSWLSVGASTGVFRPDDETLSVSGGVSIYSDLGYEFHIESAAIDLAQGLARGDERVRGQGPLGLFQAESFEADLETGLILLRGGVKATIYPGSSR